MMKGGQNVNISEYTEPNYAYFKILGITLKLLLFGTHPGLEAHQEFSPDVKQKMYHQEFSPDVKQKMYCSFQ